MKEKSENELSLFIILIVLLGSILLFREYKIYNMMEESTTLSRQIEGTRAIIDKYEK